MTDERMSDEEIKDRSWAVYVEEVADGAVVRTVFRVGHQYFHLAETDRGDEDGVQHCTFIKKMFLGALENMGVDASQAKEK